MDLVPHPEYAGTTFWYSLYVKGNGQFEQFARRPWHQYVHFDEALDVFRTVQVLVDAVTTAQKYGIEMDTKNIGSLRKAKLLQVKK